jgi:hypothetical protein
MSCRSVILAVLSLDLYILCIKCVVRMSIKIADGGSMGSVGSRPVTRHDAGVDRWVWRVESMAKEVLP